MRDLTDTITTQDIKNIQLLIEYIDYNSNLYNTLIKAKHALKYIEDNSFTYDKDTGFCEI